EHGTLFSVRYFSNWKLIGAVLISAAMLAVTIWLPQAAAIFGTAPLFGSILWQALGFSFAVPVITSVFTGKKK
ncbi:MAG: cation transporting ATPase C-terminal domain-containing protein, partial [Oscillospiraceae bacterium]|nr:cation transporting ATPase C-terminal domain-containing protein [Oscillospiraceae bacterium]